MLLRELYEAPKKVAVAAFGRMNPPTIGHEKLVNKVKSFNGDHYIFLSQTQKPKDNPLPFDVKLEFAKQFFPDVNVGHPTVRTPIQMLQMLEKLGYTDIIYVAGSDRVASFDKLFNDYNGKEYNFNSITVENAGERDPDADGAEGMSASKMRLAAAEGNLEAFSQGVPKPALAQKMYDAVRTGMGIKDKEPVEEGDLVVDKGSLRVFLKQMIADAIEKEEDIDKLSRVLKMMVGKEIKTRGNRAYTITNDDINEILGFVTKTPKRATIKKKRPPEEDSVQDKIKKRRAMAAKGDANAFKSGKVAEGDIEETIRKVKGGYRLYSKDGKKNLGTFDTRAGAEKHEREVQYFKHKG